MSGLTKASVLFVTILSVVVMAVVISFFAQLDNVNTTLTQTQDRLTEAEATAAQRQTDLEAALARHESLKDELGQENNQLASQLTTLQSQKDELQSELLTERQRYAGLEASLSRLSASEQQMATLLDTVSQELQRRREQAVERQTRLIESADRINELAASNEGLMRQVRRFRERMVADRERVSELEDRLAQLPQDVRRDYFGSDTTSTPQPSADIAGQVMQVQKLGAGEVLVQVNVGKNDQVAEGMQFLVHRGENYLGTLVVERVDTNVAVGRMTQVQDDIQKQDQVFAGRGF